MSFLDKIKSKLPFTLDKEATDIGTSVNQLNEMASSDLNQASASDSTENVDDNKKFSFGDLLKKIKGGKKNSSTATGATLNEPFPGIKIYSGNSSAKSPLDQDSSASNPLIESAIQGETAEMKQFLDLPEIDESLLNEIEPPKSILLYILKGVFLVFLIIGSGTYLFFATQLGTKLTFLTDVLHVPAAMNELKNTNDELKSAKTDLNVYNLLEGKFHLDNFSFEGDKFTRNYQIYTNKSVAESARNTAKSEMTKIREILKSELIGARDKLLADYHVTLVDPDVLDANMYPDIFKNLLIERMGSEIISREAKKDINETRDYKTYAQAKKLIENAELKNMLKTADIDTMTDKELVVFIVKLNGLAENELSAIQKIKDSKINWSAIIAEIKSQTRIVDQFFNEGLYDEAGGIQYTNYDFDAGTKRITITGTTKRYDSANFTTISDLIDQLNASPLFQGVEMKSFAKTGSAKDGYTATLRLSLQLQKDELSEEDSQLNIDSVPDFLAPQITTPVNN